MTTDVAADADRLLYLRRRDVECAAAGLDSVALVREVFAAHAAGDTILPDEAYLGWDNGRAERVRSLNMPGYVRTAQGAAIGTKIINSNPANPTRDLPRASGLTLLFDDESTRIRCVMDASFISALRTASVTLLAAQLSSPGGCDTVAIIGAGALARAHIDLLPKYHATLREIRLHDLDPARARALAAAVGPALASHGAAIVCVETAERAVRGADLVIPATTTTTGYIPYEWLQPGCVLVNVSLDDAMPDVVLRADLVFVDDWNLVRTDPRRLLGRMYRAGTLAGPDGSMIDGGSGARRVDAELGDLVAGRAVARRHSTDIVYVNPFGLAIEDVWLANQVYRRARALSLGQWLEA